VRNDKNGRDIRIILMTFARRIILIDNMLPNGTYLKANWAELRAGLVDSKMESKLQVELIGLWLIFMQMKVSRERIQKRELSF